MVNTKRTNEALWERVKTKITAQEIAGTKAGEWSARKAQLAVKEYKRLGGGYVGKKSVENSLVKWTEQDWKTKSGKPSSETGERYLPRKAIEALSPQQYGTTTRAKRKGTKKGEQYVSQPEAIINLVRKYRD
jgi:hypothetical protein